MATARITMADLAADRADIIALWQRALPTLPEARYDWIYEGGPRGPARCWLARDASHGGVVGGAALFPRRLRVEGGDVSAAIAGDFAVDAAHRGFGPALALQKEVIAGGREHGFSVLFGFPNRQAEAIQRRAGFRPLGAAGRFTRVLRWRSALARRLPTEAVARALAAPADLLSRIMAREIYYRRAHDHDVECPPTIDGRFDDLWRRTAPRHRVIGERTSDYLTWRFLRSPHRRYEIFALANKSSRQILGWVAWYETPDETFIADLLTDGDEGVLDALVSEFLLAQRRRGAPAVSLVCLAEAGLIRALKRHHFIRRPDERRVLVSIDPESPHARILCNPSNWRLLEGDGDI